MTKSMAYESGRAERRRKMRALKNDKTITPQERADMLAVLNFMEKNKVCVSDGKGNVMAPVYA